MSNQLVIGATVCPHGSHSAARCPSMDAHGFGSKPNVARCGCCGCEINLWGTGLGYLSCRRCHAGREVAA